MIVETEIRKYNSPKSDSPIAIDPLLMPSINRTPSRPTVSVVMPVYNHEHYVQTAISSILAQTFNDFELIVVDDGSTDRTAARIAAIKDPRIRYIQAEHKGFISTLVRGYEEARGTWIARMDSDDLCYPQRLARQMEFLTQHPECAFVGTAYGFVTPNGYCLAPEKRFDWRHVKSSEITLGGRVFGDATVVFHRQTARRLGYHDAEFNNENPLWYRLLRHSQGAVLGEPLYLIRWLMGSLSRTKFRRLSEAHLKMRTKYDPENAAKLKPVPALSDDRAFTRQLKKGLHIYLRAGDRQATLNLAWSGWSSLPYSTTRIKMLLYCILGIEGIRLKRLRARRDLMVRCPAPVLDQI